MTVTIVRGITAVASDVGPGSGGTIGGNVEGGTPGSVLFIDASGNLGQDNANFFYDATKHFLGLGTASPAARLDIAGNISSPAWAQQGIALRVEAATYTDTTSTGTVPVTVNNLISGGVIAASNAIIITTIVGTKIDVITAGTNVTQGQTPTALWVNGNTIVTGASSNLFIAASGIGGAVKFQVSSATNGMAGVGSVPSAKLHIVGNETAAAWTTNGIALRIDSATYTDSASSGTIAAVYGSHIGTAFFAASSTTTYTNAVNLYVESPNNGTNVTIGNPYALVAAGRTSIVSSSGSALSVVSAISGTPTFIIQNNSFPGLGLFGAAAASLHVNANTLSQGNTSTSGISLRIDGGTFNNTSTAASGTVPVFGVNAIGVSTLTATNANVTYTSAATLYIAGTPAASTNITIPNGWGIYVNAGSSYFSGGIVVGGNNSPVYPSSLVITPVGSVAYWGSNGALISETAHSITDTSSATGTVGVANAINALGIITVNASNASVVYSNSASLYIAGAPVAGTNVTLTNSYALWIAGGIFRTDGGRAVATRSVTAAGAVTVSATTDYYVGINKTVGAATVVNLPAGVTGMTFVIKDEKGDAAANNITITPAAGNIDNAGTKIMNVNLQSVTLFYNGTQWTVN